jgi:hypothetical protein
MIFRPAVMLLALALLVFCAAVAEAGPATGTTVAYTTTATGRVVGSLGFSPMTSSLGMARGNFRPMTPGFGRIRNRFSTYYNNQFAPMPSGFGPMRPQFQPMVPRFRPPNPNIGRFDSHVVPITPNFAQQTRQPFSPFYRNSFGQLNQPFTQIYRQGFSSMAPNFGTTGPHFQALYQLTP